MSSFTATYDTEPEDEIVAIEPQSDGGSDSSDDDWNYLKNFNALYISLGSIVIMTIIVVASHLRD